MLAGICITFLVTGCAVALRAYRGEKEYTVFLGCFLSSLILYSILFGLLPANLGFLPRGLIEPAATVDSLNGALALLLTFHGIWTFTYMASPGATMRVLLQLTRKRRQGLTLDEMVLQFESGDLTNMFLRRRLPKLINGGFITEQTRSYGAHPGIPAGIGIRDAARIGAAERLAAAVLRHMRPVLLSLPQLDHLTPVGGIQAGAPGDFDHDPD